MKREPLYSITTPDPDIAALLIEMRDILLRMERLQAANQRNALSRADRRAMEALLPELARSARVNPAWQDKNWTAREMIDYAAGHDEGIMSVLIEFLGDSAGMAKRLGRLLNRAQGVSIEGMFIELLGVERGAGLYVLRV
jgi:hypothetical protein